MHQLKFTLKQHTPIIHFQHKQEGATLRAMEVKPKLDRFIIAKMGGKDKMDKTWFNNYEKGSLDYKMRIEPVSPHIYEIPKGENIGSFFGAMGNDYFQNPRCLSIVADDIECIIIAKCNSLKEKIRNSLNYFFSINNFGMRQSKGFGSFSLIKINNESQIFPTANFNYSFQLNFSTDVSDFSAQKNLAGQIDVFYRSLRSGINLSGKNGESLYFKSALFMYLNSKNIQWDKKTIKANYFNKTSVTVSEIYRDRQTRQEKKRNVAIKYIPDQQLNHKHSGTTPDILDNPQTQNENLILKLFRDRLGLSSEEKWYSYRENLTKTEAKQNHAGWQIKRKDEEQIARYKSPILFKVIIDIADKKATVYFDVFEEENTLASYVKSVFSIDTKPDRNVTGLTNQNGLFMPLANTTDLNLKLFLAATFRTIDPKSHIQSSIQNEQMKFVYDTLVDVYVQLKPKDNNDQ